MWFIGVEVEQETSAPPPKKKSGSAPETPDQEVFLMPASYPDVLSVVWRIKVVQQPVGVFYLLINDYICLLTAMLIFKLSFQN